MALNDILVYVDDSEGVAGTVAAACSLARQHDAHLTGQAVERSLGIPGFASVEISPSAMEIINRNQREAVDKWRRTFEAAVDAAGVTGKSGWAVARGELVACLSLRSRYADLTVVSQTNPERRAGGDNPVDDLIVVSGRPILVIPYIGARAEIGRKVLIAWNASREAARAVTDAMPLLETAESIEIFAVEPHGMGDIPGADIAEHLARHGLDVGTAKTTGIDMDVGDVLLNHAADSGADLIVMGAYGHSRMREMVLGGATRHVLEHMTVPVLLSH